MTRISFRNERGQHRIRAEGHAGGSPEVCAGISALLGALGGWLANGSGEATVIRLGEGKALLYCGQKSVEVEAAFDTAIIGLLQIQKEHPEFLSVEQE